MEKNYEAINFNKECYTMESDKCFGREGLWPDAGEFDSVSTLEKKVKKSCLVFSRKIDLLNGGLAEQGYSACR